MLTVSQYSLTILIKSGKSIVMEIFDAEIQKHYHQHSFKCFVKSFSLTKLLSKVPQFQTIISGYLRESNQDKCIAEFYPYAAGG